MFSKWTRTIQRLDAWLGYRRYDIDSVWWNKKKEFIMIIEEKIGNSVYNPSGDQAMTYDIMEEALRDWCKKHNWQFKGKHVLRFPNKDMSVILLNGKEITEEELIDFLE